MFVLYALLAAAITITMLLGLCVIAACMRSSQISQYLEQHPEQH